MGTFGWILIEALALLVVFAVGYRLWLRPSALEGARREAELEAKQIVVEAKEEMLKHQQQADSDLREKRQELTTLQNKLAALQESLDSRERSLASQEADFETRKAELESEFAKLESLRLEWTDKIESVSGMNKQQARKHYMSEIESSLRDEANRLAKQIEQEAVRMSDERAKKLVLETVQRASVEYVTEATLAVVDLPSEDMKGRIIGREGRNIRAFEQVTGVDLIIDETPEAVVISCFDPVRREVARLTLMNLMLDGRIQPVRIEELYEKAKLEVERMIFEAGDRAVERAGVTGLNHATLEVLGKLRFRTSYGQNVLDHSVEVAKFAANMAAELGFNVEIARRAGLLHDIGKALSPEWEGPHALVGMEFLKQQGETEAVTHAVGAHHHEIEPATPEAHLVIVADSISAARPGARRESLDNFIKRLSQLEELAMEFPGVDRSFAIHAGRELRLLVRPGEVDDLGAAKLAGDVARKIESEMEYPGQIRVTVIRETRVQDVAR